MLFPYKSMNDIHTLKKDKSIRSTMKVNPNDKIQIGRKWKPKLSFSLGKTMNSEWTLSKVDGNDLKEDD